MLTNYAENKLVDYLRGQGLAALPADWHIALVSAYSDSAFTELSGTGYARQTVGRTLADWAGTQGDGTTLASTGNSHTTSNNDPVDWGTAGSAWGTAIGVVLCDADSPSNAWVFVEFDSALPIGNGDPVSLDAAALRITVGLTGGCSDYLSNKLVDLLFRGQAYAWPATTYVGYTNTASSNAAAGSEPAGSYARQAVSSALASWDNTQGARTTAASNGTSGHTSNNAPITFAVPTIDQGVAGWAIVMDAATLGNLLFWHALASPKSFTSGGTPPQFAIGALEITFD